MSVDLLSIDLEQLYEDEQNCKKVEAWLPKVVHQLSKADATSQGRSHSNWIAFIVRDWYVRKIAEARRLNEAAQDVSDVPVFGPEPRREDAKAGRRFPGAEQI